MDFQYTVFLYLILPYIIHVYNQNCLQDLSQNHAGEKVVQYIKIIIIIIAFEFSNCKWKHRCDTWTTRDKMATQKRECCKKFIGKVALITGISV